MIIRPAEENNHIGSILTVEAILNYHVLIE
jgi:hypothetical protein